MKNAFAWTADTGRMCLNVGLDKNKGGKRPVCADLTTIAMDIGWHDITRMHCMVCTLLQHHIQIGIIDIQLAELQLKQLNQDKTTPNFLP